MLRHWARSHTGSLSVQGEPCVGSGACRGTRDEGERADQPAAKTLSVPWKEPGCWGDALYQPQGGLSCCKLGSLPGRLGLPLPAGFHTTGAALSGKHIKGQVSEPDIREKI